MSARFAEGFMIEAWVELSIASLVILLRLYFRYTQVGLRGMALDDLLIVFAGVLYALQTAIRYCTVMIWHDISNNSFTPDQRASLSPDSQTWRDATHASKAYILGWMTYTGLMWVLKACWTVSYSRTIYCFDPMNVRIKFAWILIGTTYIAVVAMILFKCWPLHRQWQIYPDPGNNCYPGASKMNVAFVSALNAITDIYLMAIPLPVVFRANWSLKRRIWLCLLFSSGGVVIVFILLRCILLLKASPTDSSKSGQWSIRVSFIAVVISNAPMVYAQCKKWAVVVLQSTEISSRQRNNLSSRDPISARRLSISGRSDAVQSGRADAVQSGRAAMPPDPFHISFSTMSDATGGSYDGNVAREMTMSACGSLGVEDDTKLQVPKDERARSRASERSSGWDGTPVEGRTVC